MPIDDNAKKALMTAGFAVGALGLITSNLILLKNNRELVTAYQELRTQIQVPKGITLPPLRGATFDGRETTIRFGGDARRTVVFVFSPACPACEDNWRHWSSVIEKADPSRVRLVAVDLTGLARPDYIRAHSLDRTTLLRHIDPAGIVAYRLRLTPTTLMVDRNGKVEESWLGELDSESVKRIVEAARETRT
jgi:hypothetical protein